MRYVLIFLSVIVLLGILSFIVLGKVKQKIDSTLSAPLPHYQLSVTPTTKLHQISETNSILFVPYWVDNIDVEKLGSYDTLVYFGVAASEQGIDKQDDGYKNLSVFLKNTNGKKSYLTIRMLESKSNFAILKDEKLQDILIAESVKLAKESGFKGILLNIEVSALPFTSLVDQITLFNKRFYTESKKQGLYYGITAYGDTFYRVRPFDIPALAKDIDQMYLMAYDFHKSKGNPGPNFPLQGKTTYGYDLQTMIERFLEYIPHNKIVVVFGLYGYDWKVDENNIAQDIGEPKSLIEIKNNFIDNCNQLSCEWRRDTLSSETEVKYVAKDHTKHIIWFEDMESVKRKQALLKQRGISSFAFWAYSYF